MVSILEAFFRSDYMPHGHCYLWNKQILWVNVVSDVVIAIAYFSIPVALYYFVRKRQDLEFKGIFVLFSLFIALCGITHIIGIVVIWQGTYGIHGVAKALTAVVSFITAVQVVRIAPAAIKLPSPADLKRAMQDATDERIQRLELENQITQAQILRESTEAVYVGVLVTDNTGTIVIANDAICRIFGYKRQELEGQSINILVNKEIENHHQDLIDRFIASPEKQRHMAAGRIVTGVSKNGAEIPVEIVLSRSVQQEETFIFVSVLDLSERITHQERLLESNTRFERITASADEALWELNLTNNALWMSSKLPVLLEQPEQDTVFDRRKLLEVIHPNDIETIDRFFFGKETKENGKYVEFKARVFNGEYKWFAAKAGYTYDLSGRPLFRSGTISLIQETKVLEQKLSDQYEYFRSVFEGAGNAIFSILCKGKDLFYLENINRVAQDTMGLPWSSAKGKSIDELSPHLVPEDVSRRMKSNYARVLELKEPYEYIEMIPSKEQDFWWKTKLYPQLDEKGNIIRIVGSASDITALINTQRMLEEKEQFITRALNASLTGVYIFNKNTGLNEFVNESYTRITGYTQEQMNEMSQDEFLDCFHEDDRATVLQHMDTLFSATKDDDIELLEYRFKTASGRWVWCLSQDTVFDRDENGDVISFIGSFLDITDFKEMQFNLIQLKEAAEEANLAKSEFLANMSHEIRTPMNAILGLVQMLLQMHLGEKQKLFVNKIHTSSKFLLNVLNDILDYSKIEAGKVEIIKEPFSVYKLISETVGLFTLAAEEKGVEIVYDISRLAHNYYMGDPLRIGQMLNNVVGNAVKFTEEGTVTISFGSDDDGDRSRLVFSVEDTGIGISEENLEKLFQSFSQADTSINRRYGGTGLGLAIIRGILNQMGGDISVESQLNKGSKFTIRIPIEPADDIDAQAHQMFDPAEQDVFQEKVLKGILVLVVEDNKTNQLLAKEFLQSQGANVVLAENGVQAVELCNENWFDIILMDLQMPEMDGFEAARQIRQHSVRRDVPIIAMSAAVTEGDVNRVYSATMNDHIPKPIDLVVALEVISKWVNRKVALTSDVNEAGPDFELPASIDATVLDASLGIQKLNNQHHLYLTLVKSYLDDRAKVSNEIQAYFDAHSLNDIERTAHTIKGLAATLGATPLSKVAEAVEHKAMAGQVDQDDIAQFIGAESRARDELQKLLDATKENAPFPNDERVDRPLLDKQMLLTLESKLYSGQFLSEKEIETYQVELQPYMPAEKLSLLIKHIRMLDYDQAKGLLEAFK